MSLESIFWNTILFIYFSGKNFILSKVFKSAQLYSYPLLDFALAVVAVIFNNLLLSQYNEYRGMGYIAGVVTLPPFTILYLIADAIASLIIAIRMYPISQYFFKNPLMQIIITLMQFSVLIGIFIVITSTYATTQTISKFDIDYTCLRHQLIIDYSSYYFSNHKPPQTLAEFTEIAVNPYNGARIMFSPGNSIMAAEITDSAGNILMQGYKHLAGIDTYAENPSEYYRIFQIMGTSCSSPLRFPDPSRLNEAK